MASNGFSREFVGTIKLPSGWLRLGDSGPDGVVSVEPQQEEVYDNGKSIDIRAYFQNVVVPVYVTREDDEIVSVEIDLKGVVFPEALHTK